jgi:hypothetical protein
MGRTSVSNRGVLRKWELFFDLGRKDHEICLGSCENPRISHFSVLQLLTLLFRLQFSDSFSNKIQGGTFVYYVSADPGNVKQPKPVTSSEQL